MTITWRSYRGVMWYVITFRFTGTRMVIPARHVPGRGYVGVGNVTHWYGRGRRYTP